jgi:glyceraldehyde-3-phosphate dehydrogenase (ferredoxin)
MEAHTRVKGLLRTSKILGTKYRYDPRVKSAGTFGVNMSVLGEWLLSFNWDSVNLSEGERKALYALVKDHYLKQFNEEIVEPRTFATCGEPCPLACKKIYHERSGEKCKGIIYLKT